MNNKGSFTPVQSEPYDWPFRGYWGTDDTACLAVNITSSLHEARFRQCRNEGQEEIDRLVYRTERLVQGLLSVGFGVFSCVHPIFKRESVGIEQFVAEAETMSNVLGQKFTKDVSALTCEGFSGFWASKLESILRQREIRNLIICGIPTDTAVHSTMRDANDRGYECLLVTDCTMSCQDEHYEGILNITRFGNGLFGTTSNSEAILEVIEGR